VGFVGGGAVVEGIETGMMSGIVTGRGVTRLVGVRRRGDGGVRAGAGRREGRVRGRGMVVRVGGGGVRVILLMGVGVGVAVGVGIG
jgi:hypothetical protein